MTKKQLLEQFHKDTISEAAEILFVKQGLSKTTMDHVAKEAGYSKATLYVYFKNKEEIVYYIIWKSMQALVETFRCVTEKEGSVREQYYGLCHALADFYERRPFQFEAMMETIDADPKSREDSEVLESIYQTGEQLNEVCEQVIRAGMEQGQMRTDIPAINTAFLCWNALAGIVSMANKKEAYIKERMGVEKEMYMEQGFRMILLSLLKEGATMDE